MMKLSMQLCLLSLITLRFLTVLAVQEYGRGQAVPIAPPPQPPVKKEEKPATPARIRVGCAAQSAYMGPAPQWFSGPDSLSDTQISDFEKALSTNPENMCLRGYLIAHGQDRVLRRVDHVLWMIEHHPEWDGFMINLSFFGNPPGANEHIREAWLKQSGPDQKSGTILHHAAVFFEWLAPDLSETLLERAISLGPDIPLHVEGLGILYGRHSYHGSRNPSFSTHARSKLLSSNDPLILAGALNAISPYAKNTRGTGSELGKVLRQRLRELTVDQPPILPSRSDRHRSQCDHVPLLRQCVDTQIP